jgi:hypothetical protein
MQISFCNIICFGIVTIVSTTTLVFYAVPLVNATTINAQILVTLSSRVIYLSQEFFSNQLLGKPYQITRKNTMKKTKRLNKTMNLIINKN